MAELLVNHINNVDSFLRVIKSELVIKLVPVYEILKVGHIENLFYNNFPSDNSLIQPAWVEKNDMNTDEMILAFVGYERKKVITAFKKYQKAPVL